MEQIQPNGRSIAVIGSGVAGLTAAYVLSGRDRVTLFEADTRIGGHAHTHYLDRGDGNIVGIDSAFLVHNDRTYPTLCRLFDDLGVATQETDMSMSVRDDAGGLEYAGARGYRRAVPDLVVADPAPLSGDAGRGQAVPPGRHPPAAQRVRRQRRNPRVVPRPPRLLAVLHRLLHDAARRRGVVMRARATRSAIPPAICSSSWSTTECFRCSAHRPGAPSPADRPTTSRRS